MVRALLAVIVVSLASCLMIASARMGDGPAVFDPRPYPMALEAAQKEKKLLVLVFGAEWCGPCKQMERTTWVDEKVVGWLNRNAIALHIDIDKQGELGVQYKASGLPTVVIVKDGKEFDRVTGYRSAEAIMKWFASIQHGARSIDALRAAAVPSEDGKVNIHAKLDLARALQADGQFAASCDEYLWLWENMLTHQPSMLGVRTSFMVNDMERLAAADASAKAKLAMVRDRAEAALVQSPTDARVRLDWMMLNRVVGDEDRTLAWFDRAKGDAAQKPVIEGVAQQLQNLLIERGRFGDYGSLVVDPELGITQVFSVLAFARKSDEQIPDAAAREAALKASSAYARKSASVLYASLLAAGREVEAEKIARVSIKQDAAPAMKMALVEMALKAKSPRAEHRAWLEELAKGGENVADLKSKLDAMLPAGK